MAADWNLFDEQRGGAGAVGMSTGPQSESAPKLQCGKVSGRTARGPVPYLGPSGLAFETLKILADTLDVRIVDLVRGL
jgi:hypothetical protein